MTSSPSPSPSPFHAGELRVQERLGVRETIGPWAARVVRPYLPEEHRAFHTALPFLVAAARDARGRPWATLLTGAPGFVTSPDPRRLHIAARALPGDALDGALAPGNDVGLLGIEFATRRRNRVNGRITATGDAGLEFHVGQAFGNCPQHIRPRGWRRVAPPDPVIPARRSASLTEAQQDWIRAADTLFIASGWRDDDGDHAAFGMDASHRGGPAGFVTVPHARTLVIPDYAGNDHYNTVGNLVQDPRAGVTFVDFARGSLLQLTGRTTIDWDPPPAARATGARRLLVLTVEAVVELPGALPLRFEDAGSALRELRVVERERESADVTSFVLAARAGGLLPPFEAGQHLPVSLPVPGQSGLVQRSYSLSGPAGAATYRISVKREPHGIASRFLHDAVEIGAFVGAHVPGGDFVLADDDRPVVLVSAGVGVTPMISMLHALAAPGERREVWFVHGARDGAHHALAAEARALLDGHARMHRLIAYSRPSADDRVGRDYDLAGRLDAATVLARVPAARAEIYLCGPTAFVNELAAGLEDAGVGPERIHVEHFTAGT